MKLDTLLLADAAIEDAGKLYLHGAGITSLRPPRLPWFTGQLSVIVRLELEPNDRPWKEHQVQVQLVDPKGEVVIPSTPVKLSEAPPESEVGEDVFMQLVLTWAPVIFATAGVYKLRVELDGSELRTLSLGVIEPESPDESQ